MTHKATKAYASNPARVTVIEEETPLDLYKRVLTLFLYDGFDPITGEMIFDACYTDSYTMTRLWCHNFKMIARQGAVNNLDLALTGFDFPRRWDKFLKEYSEAEGFRHFLSLAIGVGPWQTAGYTAPIIARHTMGNCLMGLTATKGQGGQAAMVNVFSRATMIAPVGGLDIGFGSATIEALVNLGFPAKNFSLVWDVSMVQAVSWKMLLSLAMLDMIPLKADGSPDLPDTMMGRRVAQHYVESMKSEFPKLKMFARPSVKLQRLVNDGAVSKTADKTFKAQLPANYYP